MHGISFSDPIPQGESTIDIIVRGAFKPQKGVPFTASPGGPVIGTCDIFETKNGLEISAEITDGRILRTIRGSHPLMSERWPIETTETRHAP